jgi:hypothetical protein
MADIVEKLHECARTFAPLNVNGCIEAANEIERLRAALGKVRSYNVDIAAGRINYRPHDHIEVIDRALNIHKRGEK